MEGGERVLVALVEGLGLEFGADGIRVSGFQPRLQSSSQIT